ncbi:MAG: hypothetical protein QXO93_02855, partial [Acidilobaceae archaeon]
VVKARGKIIALALALTMLLAFAPIPSESGKVVIAFDISHRQSPEGLELLANMTKDYYRVLIAYDQSDLERVPEATLKLFNEVRMGGFTRENLVDVDILLIGQPEALPRPGEVDVLKEWFSKPNKALWIAADSDFPAQGSERAQQFMNIVLEALGSSIRIDYISVEEYTENIGGAPYRVVGVVDPSPEIRFLAEGLTHHRVLFHGPGGLYVLVEGKPINPVKQLDLKPKNVYTVVRTTENSKVVDNSPEERGGLPPVFYDPLNDAVNKGPFPLMLVETFPNNRVIIASSETMYGGYRHMIVKEYRNRPLDGPVFVGNILKFLVSVVSKPLVVTETKTVTQTQILTETKPITITQVQTETVQVGVSTPIAAAIAIIALIIGVAAAFLLRR